jgi:hypothetical protein
MAMIRFTKVLLASALVLLTTGVANADHYRCRQAAHRLERAQAAHDQAWSMVLNNASICPGGWQRNAACMATLANHYNAAKAELDRAQSDYYRACRF